MSTTYGPFGRNRPLSRRPTKFQATADRRAKSFVAKSSKTIVDSKRKLQEPSKLAKALKYRTHSAILVSQGYRFPSELLAPYGVKNLIRKAKPKGSKAYEIPELLRDALCFPLSTSEDVRLEDIREKRNDIAHGKGGPIALAEALNHQQQAWRLR